MTIPQEAATAIEKFVNEKMDARPTPTTYRYGHSFSLGQQDDVRLQELIQNLTKK